jgi:hypothetical protein
MVATGALLIRKIGILDRLYSGAIPVHKHPAKFDSRRFHPARDDQSCITEINNADIATLIDSPTMAQLGRKAGLTSIGDSGVGRRRHPRIVPDGTVQGAA